MLATGYGYVEPGFLAGVQDRIARDSRGRFAVGRNYSTGVEPGEIFVQNAELHTHGFVTPGPRHGRVPQLLHPARHHRPRGLPRGTKHRVPAVRHAAAPGLPDGPHPAACPSRPGCAHEFTFRCLDPETDAPLLHSWVTQPYASFWGMLGCPREDVVAEYSRSSPAGITTRCWGLTAAFPPS